MPVTYPEGLLLGVSQVELETSQVAGYIYSNKILAILQ